MKLFAKISFYLLISLSGIFILSCSNKVDKATEIRFLNNNWHFEFENKIFQADVPGNIHTDLCKNKLISNPFYGDNEKDLQWVGQQEWHYFNEFEITETDLQQNIEIVFDGIDTHSKIILNDKEIGRTDNMFRQWEIPINQHLITGKNTLEIVFFPVESYNKTEASKLSYKMPDERVFSRKAPYHSGWDWGPKFETCGIWRPVYLRIWKSYYCENFSVKCNQISGNNALLTAYFNFISEGEKNIEIKIHHNQGNNKAVIKKVDLRNGANAVQIDFEIENPKLWHCNGRGEANLYKFTAIISSGCIIDTIETTTGIKTAKLISTPDSIGQSFYFELNGKPVFAKGANWIPTESFPGSVSRDKYRKLLIMAKDAGFNMMRVWGGGYYEDNYFYDLCDSLGIMVWQDFMFACAPYPGDDRFIKNITEEIRQNITRLKAHPCIVLWCGNNEISNGWYDWGWQKAYNWSSADSAEIWNNNLQIFRTLIPKIIVELDNGRSYCESSPMFGWGHPENNTHGDAHYWGVWWGKEDFEMYYSKTGRFMSEYGFQSMPSLYTMYQIADSNSFTIQSPDITNHQKHPFGFENIEDGLQTYLYQPTSDEEYVYLSQVLQAIAMQTAFDAHLSKAPYCMGSLFWQYNDCWPAISWSAVDYYLNPKALYYMAKRMFKSVSLCYRPDGKTHDFFVFSDSKSIKNANAVIELCDFSGNVLVRTEKYINVVAGHSVEIDFDKSLFFKKQKNADTFLKVKLYNQQQTIAERVFFFEKDNKLNLLQPEIKITQTQTGDSIVMQISSDKLARWVVLEAENLFFSDNYFDLLPGETRMVYATSLSGKFNPQTRIGFNCMNYYKKH